MEIIAPTLHDCDRNRRCPTHWLWMNMPEGDPRDCLKASPSWTEANTNTYGAYSPPGTWPLLSLIDPQSVETVSSRLWLNAGWGGFQGNIPVALVGNVLSLHSGWKSQQRQVTHQLVSTSAWMSVQMSCSWPYHTQASLQCASHGTLLIYH